MNNLRQMRLTTKIYVLVAILMAGLILSAVFSYVALSRFKSANDLFINKVLIGKHFEAELTNPSFGLYTPLRISYMMQSTHNASELQGYYSEMTAFKEKYSEELQWARTHLAETEIKTTVLGPFDRGMQAFFSLWETQFWPSVQAGNTEVIAQLLNGPILKSFQEITQLNHHIFELEVKLNNDRVKLMNDDYGSANASGQTALWVSILVVLLGLLVSIWVAASVNARLKEIVHGITSVSSEINSQIDSQGSNVSQLSTSVHETTTSMDELNASFQHTESLATESSDRAKNALKHSDEGNNLTTEMLERLTLHKDKVSAIVDQIARLSDITHQIHNVAAATSNLTNQTNILALNAAVQSAHVKQGTEGFSVIASEIRKLADESKKFLSHIDVLAENIKHATDVTMTLAEDGAKTLQESIKLAQSVSKSFSSIQTINNGSFEGAEQVVLNVKQQVHAVQQVLGAMEIVNTVSQGTLSGMTEVRSELKKLNVFSETLKALV